jgi:hypothetical protein
VHGCFKYVSKAWLREELTSKSLGALMIVSEEAVPCVLSNGVKDEADVAGLVGRKHLRDLRTKREEEEEEEQAEADELA